MHRFKRSHLQWAGVIFLLLLAAIQLWYNNANNQQATGAIAAQVRFEGEYRIGGGPWQQITDSGHIPATKGYVTLRGNFHRYSPDGEYTGLITESIPLAFYTNHISLTFYRSDGSAYTIDHENPLFGVSACGVSWTAHILPDNSGEPIEIVVHNPHLFGNELAIDEMLANIAIWSGLDFEKGIMASGQGQRNTGLFFVIVSLIIFGSALFSALLHIPSNRIIWLLGTAILSAGIYLAYSAPGVSFWSENTAFNTSILGFSMMFYMLFISQIITDLLKKTNWVATAATIVLGLANGVCLILPVWAGLLFYDTWLLWLLVQSAANVLYLVCMAIEFPAADRKERWLHIGMALLLIGFEADLAANAAGWWEGGLICKYIFFILFGAAMFVVLRIIPDNIKTAAKARELEAELKESRVSIMLSQIQPHFIYNTLGTIERMCLKDPQRAFELVRNFSLYLRGNFSELDSVTPIRFSQELKHVEHYVHIEKVRFPDMNIEYDVETVDFVLPALTVQPLVENAIKHGLMRLESGGNIWIRSYDTSTHFCVEVKDDGGGFDTSLPVDGKKHVGLRNIRGRLQAMVNGELIVESQPGVGTKALILIPKE